MARSDYWLKHIESFQSGESKPLSVYCRENDLAYQTMLYWYRKYKKNQTPIEGNFLPVKMVDKLSPKKIKVTLGDLAIELEKGFDGQLLSEVVSALRGASC